MMARLISAAAAAFVLAICGRVVGGEAPKPAVAGEPAIKTEAVKAVTFPDRKVPEPEERGMSYPVPATRWEQHPVIWGWTCELPDGSGLAFGGVHQTADDGNPHTDVLEAGKWKPIIEDLRKNNPLQKRFEQVRSLRDACKDSLAKARHIYFEGKTADEEGKFVKADVDPAVDNLAKDLAALSAEIKGLAGLGEYEAGQVKFALTHLEAAVGQIKPFGARASPGQMATMRRAQIELEIAGEAFDAEPPPRALSRIAFEPKTKLFVIFGGEHMDYVTNDLWILDPAKNRWFQRHPGAAPEPRGDSHLDALGDGRVAMRGGYTYGSQLRYADMGPNVQRLLNQNHSTDLPLYAHVGPARWIYDVEKNTWTADGHQEKTFPPDSRGGSYRPPAAPEHFMTGPRPDAAANEALLKALPINTWVRLKTPVALGGRDWGTWAFDADRDMFYVWAGGHCSYGGNDVARYHLATDRWEITEPVSLPLGGLGTNEQYPAGVDFNRRPWVKRHTWNSHAFDPVLRKMVQMGDTKLDPYFYLYDPDKADWTSRHGLGGIPPVIHGLQLRNTKHGMLCWVGDQVWLLDAKSLEWKRMAVKGKMPGSPVDSCGMVYDPKRDRMLFATLGGYMSPYNGELYALDFATSQVTALSPEGMDNFKNWQMILREVAYHPDSDLFIWPERYTKGKITSPDLFPAYDPGKNRWVLVKIAVGPGVAFNSLSGFIVHDAKRGLLWSGHSGGNGGVCVLRFDSAKAEITPLKDFVPSGEKK